MEGLLAGLVWLLFLPYRLWKNSTESSRIGVSELERKSLRFWKRFAYISLIILVSVGSTIFVMSQK